MLDLRHLTYFRTVAEMGSIAKAAAALRVTQPTLSRQIAQLERSLGYQLLRRTPRGTSLTPAGEGLREHAKTIFTHLDQVPGVLRTFSSGERLLNLGLPPGLPREWFESYDQELRRTLPQVKLSLHEGTSEEQRTLLQQGLLDVGLVHHDPPELKSVPIFTQRFGCAVLDPTAFKGRESISFKDLDGFSVMAHSSRESAGEEVRLRAAAEAQGVNVDWVFRMFSEHSQLIAKSLSVDMVLVSEESALRKFTSWTWIPLESSDPNASVTTWAAWANPQLLGLDDYLQAMHVATTVTTAPVQQPSPVSNST